MGNQNFTTHVANAYPEEIAARVTINKQLVIYEKGSTSIGVSSGGASVGIGEVLIMLVYLLLRCLQERPWP